MHLTNRTPFRALLPLLLAAVAASAQAPAESPLHGEWEGEMRTPTWPMFITLRLRPEGAEPGTSLTVLGATHAASEAQIAADSLTMRIGEGAGALNIGAALRDGLLVGRLTQGRDTLPFALRRIPVPPPPRDRVEAWEQDIDALTTRFIALDRSFSQARRALFLEQLADTREQLADLHDDEVVVRLASAIALSGNAHSRLYILRNASEVRRLPVRLWWFADGLHVIRAAPDHAGLVGCRVDAIGGTVVRQARDLVAPLFAGNPSWTDYKSVYSLTSPEVLHGVGLVASPDSVPLRVSGCPSGAVSAAVLRPLPLVRRNGAVEAWWDLSPRHPGADSTWTYALPAAGTLPLYLRNPTRNYWFEHLPEEGVLYSQYNRAQHAADESTADFGARLLAAISEHRPRAFVMDVRFNTGGNYTLAAELMKQLEEATRGTDRYIITGRATFSAGITQVAAWREAGPVTIVGEPVGDALDMWSEGGDVVLPNSGFRAHFANGAHRYSPAPCPAGEYCVDLTVSSVAPDLPVSQTWAEYRAGRDPALEAILSRVAASRR